MDFVSHFSAVLAFAYVPAVLGVSNLAAQGARTALPLVLGVSGLSTTFALANIQCMNFKRA
jgi:hypothetical protein